MQAWSIKQEDIALSVHYIKHVIVAINKWIWLISENLMKYIFNTVED